jgi:hypothetical protein
MSRQRRYVSVGLGLVTLFTLGFVVAVASRSRPGGPGDDPVFELDTRYDINLSQLFAWILVVLTVLGAIILVFAIKEVRPRPVHRGRSYLGVVLAVIVFLLIYRLIQPLAETLVGEQGSPNEVEAPGEVGTSSGGPAVWLFSLLVAAVVAAALTRVGLAVRQADTSFDRPVPTPVRRESAPLAASRPNALVLGTDPRSRVLTAYQRFEDSAAERGLARRATETATRHARRVARESKLNEESLNDLMVCYSRARFGFRPPTEAEADASESLSSELCLEMRT